MWIAGVPTVAYALWVIVVRTRFGVWPFHKAGATAFLSGMTAWFGEWRPFDWAVFLGGFAIVIAVIAIARRTIEGQIVLVFGALSLLLGKFVWHKWDDFGRILLPMWVFGMQLVLATVVGRSRSRAATPGLTRAPSVSPG